MPELGEIYPEIAKAVNDKMNVFNALMGQVASLLRGRIAQLKLEPVLPEFENLLDAEDIVGLADFMQKHITEPEIYSKCKEILMEKYMTLIGGRFGTNFLKNFIMLYVQIGYEHDELIQTFQSQLKNIFPPHMAELVDGFSQFPKGQAALTESFNEIINTCSCIDSTLLSAEDYKNPILNHRKNRERLMRVTRTIRMDIHTRNIRIIFNI